MTIEENKEIAKRFIQELQNAKNLEIIDELLIEDCLIHVSSKYVEKEKYKRIVESNHKYFPDMHIEVINQIAEGDIVASQWKNHFTHTHEILGIKPTYEEMQISGVSIYKIIGGKIVEIWIYFDRPIK
ncbi:MAG: hypothetical protein GTO02_01960 [Candidatus Dadabacteria bacterium]|nr:hypothetical protein [Candidatus Dadabacteria bacterium]NIQ13202.1 hypothetical protein [Candidatus Dadabacteria bacterium]